MAETEEVVGRGGVATVETRVTTEVVALVKVAVKGKSRLNLSDIVSRLCCA